MTDKKVFIDPEFVRKVTDNFCKRFDNPWVFENGLAERIAKNGLPPQVNPQDSRVKVILERCLESFPQDSNSQE